MKRNFADKIINFIEILLLFLVFMLFMGVMQ